MKDFAIQRVNTILSVGLLACVTFVAAKTIIDVSTDDEIEFRMLSVEYRIENIEREMDMIAKDVSTSTAEAP